MQINNNKKPVPDFCLNTAKCPLLQSEVSFGEIGRPVTWVDVAGLFPAPRDCLAAFLVSSAAEVLAGVKPANFVRVFRRKLPCGRSIYRLWQDYSEELLADSHLRALILREDSDAMSLLLYRPDLLERRLLGRTMQTFLQQRGYPQPLTLNTALEHLQNCFSVHDSPDEVGMFLGYPYKDVHGFITQRSKPWPGRCLWRIYGPPHRSLGLYRRYSEKRNNMNDKLVSGVPPTDLLMAA